MTPHFQNENLIALLNGTAVAVVPDLITVLDVDTWEPITTEHLRYGFRVDVIGMACHDAWRTPAGLELAGPEHFGYDVAYVPIEPQISDAVARSKDDQPSGVRPEPEVYP